MRRLGWIAGLTCLALPQPAAPQACSGPDQRLSQLPDPFRSIRAVIGYGGTGFDLAERANRSPCLAQRYRRFVSNDIADYTRLSPVNHLAPPNARAFLLLAEDKDADATAESKEAVARFVGAGVDAHFAAVPVQREGAPQTYFMLEPDGSGSEVVPFLRTQFADGPDS